MVNVSIASQHVDSDRKVGNIDFLKISKGIPPTSDSWASLTRNDQLNKEINKENNDLPCCTTLEELLTAIGGISNLYSSLVVFSLGSLWLLTALPIMAPAFVSPFEKNPNDKFVTVQDEFQLKMSWYNPAELTGSAVFLGNIIAGQLLAALTDTYGRRPLVGFCLLFSGLFGVVSAFAPNFEVLLLCRFFLGVFYTPSFVSNFILACECIPFESHGTASIIFGLFWVAGYCLKIKKQKKQTRFEVSPIALLFPNWRHTLLACSLPSVIMSIVLLFFLPESLSFLIVKKRSNEAEKWVKTACAFGPGQNRKINYDMDQIVQNADTKNSNDSCFAMVRHTFRKDICVIMIFSGYLWICDFFVYNGLSYASTGLNAGNDHINYILSGLIEIPAYIICPKLLDRLGRRSTVCMLHVAAGAILLSMVLIPDTNSLYVFVWLAAKFCCASTFQCLFVYGAEIFPVECRNFALGVCCSLSNIGAILSPHAPSLNQIFPQLMYPIFGGCCILAALSTLMLPETLHHHDPIHEMESKAKEEQVTKG